MKYSFGVPAWLGALKVSLVLFGIPALAAFLITPLVGRRLELSRLAETATFIGILSVGAVALLVISAVRSRSAAPKKK